MKAVPLVLAFLLPQLVISQLAEQFSTAAALDAARAARLRNDPKATLAALLVLAMVAPDSHTSAPPPEFIEDHARWAAGAAVPGSDLQHGALGMLSRALEGRRAWAESARVHAQSLALLRDEDDPQPRASASAQPRQITGKSPGIDHHSKRILLALHGMAMAQYQAGEAEEALDTMFAYRMKALASWLAATPPAAKRRHEGGSGGKSSSRKRGARGSRAWMGDRSTRRALLFLHFLADQVAAGHAEAVVAKRGTGTEVASSTSGGGWSQDPLQLEDLTDVSNIDDEDLDDDGGDDGDLDGDGGDGDGNGGGGGGSGHGLGDNESSRQSSAKPRTLDGLTVAEIVDEDRCDIDRRTTLSVDEFLTEYVAKNKPVLIGGDEAARMFRGWRALERWQRPSFMQEYGQVTLAAVRSSDSVVPYRASGSSGKCQRKKRNTSSGHDTTDSCPAAFSTLAEYVAFPHDAFPEAMRPTRSNKAYSFGGLDMQAASMDDDWQVPDLVIGSFAWYAHRNASKLPARAAEKRKQQTLFYLGKAGSGAQMHAHTPALNMLVWGKKKWLLSAPGVDTGTAPAGPAAPAASGKSTNGGIPTRNSTGEWLVTQRILSLSHDDGGRPPRTVLECTQRSQEMVYVPDMWHHATLNLVETIGLALELGPPATRLLDPWRLPQQGSGCAGTAGRKKNAERDETEQKRQLVSKDGDEERDQHDGTVRHHYWQDLLVVEEARQELLRQQKTKRVVDEL